MDFGDFNEMAHVRSLDTWRTLKALPSFRSKHCNSVSHEVDSDGTGDGKLMTGTITSLSFLRFITLIGVFRSKAILFVFSKYQNRLVPSPLDRRNSSSILWASSDMLSSDVFHFSQKA